MKNIIAKLKSKLRKVWDVYRFPLMLIAGFAFSVLMISLVSFPVSAQNGPPEIISVLGKVPGKDLFVHAWVVVPPGVDKNEAAMNALANQGARPFASEKFETNGLVWDQFSDGNPGNDFMTQNYNPRDDPTGGGEAALLNTHDTWNAVSTSNFYFDYGGNTGRCPSLVQECPGPQQFDGNNDVGWRNLGGCCTLGVTWFSTSIDEADIALNPKFSWSVDGVSHHDVETVFLHENGHALGLGHTDIQEAVMYASYQGVRQSLHQDDIDGISTLYPGVSNSPPSVSILSPPDGSEFSSGETIDFTGTASDAEDGDLTASISWSSDIDGSIGMGASISVVLSDGAHVITAQVTDSGGITSSDSITITVGDAPAPTDLTVTSIDPTSVNRGDTGVVISVFGTGFDSTAQISFENGSGPSPDVTSVAFVDSGTLQATIDVKSGGPPKASEWDVRVTLSNGDSAVLAGALTVNP